MSEVYRPISDVDFRGDGYLDAIVKAKVLWLDAKPPSYQGAFRKGNRLILQVVTGRAEYLVLAVDGNDPIPTYAKPAAYYIHPRHLANITPRRIEQAL